MAEGRCLLLLEGSAGDKDSVAGAVVAIAGVVRSLRGILIAHEKLKRSIGLARGTENLSSSTFEIDTVVRDSARHDGVHQRSHDLIARMFLQAKALGLGALRCGVVCPCCWRSLEQKKQDEEISTHHTTRFLNRLSPLIYSAGADVDC